MGQLGRANNGNMANTPAPERVRPRAPGTLARRCLGSETRHEARGVTGFRLLMLEARVKLSRRKNGLLSRSGTAPHESLPRPEFRLALGPVLTTLAVMRR
jgi:hypothetical protein